ncbi:aromatic amino acid transporter [Rodentibacter pneumotropicus]|uniref:aromatic amino acid transporter n=1 Tax=Rodentibacter pneumotropicus TaxID=758 RepID=UPI00037D2315|nr:aromatic amino acid transporter [Rodentibacter pneumotropicus]MDC2826456.1 aromatic amino acid transporter [Rodentibacter pneumotropicus]NBH76336.1 tyrosine transporter [Rodentibacter pneumotropicus]OOF61595.1 tyrosine transporter [Rodentibacter pneumotropicus]OOF64862.1 tyrosine transporter [Rodentibacter pneumotropicus]THA03641.1 tyrosine transporter [Rodentibacter pneumotropicus]
MLKNKTFGSALIIAGTTIGAGMLAMPLTSAGMGFGYTVLLLIGLWTLLVYSGLLFVEVYQTADQLNDGVATLAEKYFGVPGRILATLSLLILLYALSAAYITGGGSLLSGLPTAFGMEAMSLQTAIILFTVVLGSFVVIGTKGVDGITRLLFIGKLLAFAFVLFMMLPKVATDNLMALPLNYAFVISASPIFFTSFGFHVIMASVNSYLNGNVRQFRKAILIGTAIPLFAYLVWQLATHGVLSQSEFVRILQAEPTLNGLVNAVREITGSNMMGEVVRIFSALALITSFLGVMLGVFEGLVDLFKRYHLPHNRLSLTVTAFTPPLVFALFYPEGFISALSYAGLLCAFYCLILPIGLAWRTRQVSPNLPYRVMGGNLALTAALIIGIIIMVIPFLIQAGYLPAVAG